ncbi:hypothetical protein Scep_007417 [Stephania cephalantha]|uniref:Uncharacterized protein n=1 Tax=Stephania cephalantha TaxID=152367 RepID=A0AAP0PNT7_9MAGN
MRLALRHDAVTSRFRRGRQPLLVRGTDGSHSVARRGWCEAAVEEAAMGDAVVGGKTGGKRWWQGRLLEAHEWKIDWWETRQWRCRLLVGWETVTTSGRQRL